MKRLPFCNCVSEYVDDEGAYVRMEHVQMNIRNVQGHRKYSSFTSLYGYVQLYGVERSVWYLSDVHTTIDSGSVKMMRMIPELRCFSVPKWLTRYSSVHVHTVEIDTTYEFCTDKRAMSE